MAAVRIPRRCVRRLCRCTSAGRAVPLLLSSQDTVAPHRRDDGPRYHQRRSLSSGMDAFMEFEREMALKRRLEKGDVPTHTSSSIPLTPPVKPRDDECCHLNCPNCVLLVYHEKLLEYELSLQGRQLKPTIPAPKYRVAYVAEDGPSPAQQRMLEANNSAVFSVLANEMISEPHQVSDGAWRSVRHLDLHVNDEQQLLVSQHAANIGVYAPNDDAIVSRMAAFLGVDLDRVFVADPLPSDEQKPAEDSGDIIQRDFPDRPFARIGTVREALTWSFDLITTPRSSFLRNLAAYATDTGEIERLMAPQAAEAIQAQRPMQQITMVDIFDMFPSLQLDFESFYQFAPPNAPRYYTVSSSHKFSPGTVSITLGLRELASKPLPRCSSYLSALTPGEDSVRASFLRSSFVFPYHDRRPVMLVSAGTGIAPFRAFLQDLQYEHQLAGDIEYDTRESRCRHAYLFYGCRAPETDYLYADEIQRALDDGVLDQVHVEFSDGAKRTESSASKRYVQDALAEQTELIARHLIEDDGYIFVCGGLAMGRAVKRVIAQALLAHPDISGVTTEVAAKRIVSRKLAAHQIVTELW